MKKSAHRLILLIVLAIVTLLPMSTVHAANFTAGNSAELIVAINTANGNGEADTITLTADITLNAVDNSTTGDNGLPVITSDITIEGDGHTLTRDGSAPNFRFLYVDAAGDLTLNNVTISNGRSNVDGGAIYNNGGALTISRSTLDGNYTGDDGGAIYNNGGTVTIEYSTISNNEAPTSAGFSGALDNRVGGMMTISYSILSGNRAGNGGGAIYSDTNNPTLTIIGSTLDGNTADWGGGIQCSAGTCTISGSTFSNNTGTTSSGGGGLRVSTNGTAVVTNSTITGNTSANNGGGIYVAGVLTLRHVTLAGNSAPTGANLYRDSGSTVNVASSIIADPVSGGNCSGAITDNGGNLEAESSGSYTCPATFTQTTTSGLGALADNGGPTGTMALDTASLAVDGTGAACGGAPTNGLDQRGYPRDALCDIGAFEY
ncbi:MAG: hypothetical protein JXJ17_12655, partial [Anaerolineae bacterium]|nr:hypothetical protein [Anaerolineae bacterium]